MAGGSSGKSETEMRINFAALKKIDENIEHIIDTASSVAHYKFNSGSGVWVSITKSSIEVLIIACFGQSNVNVHQRNAGALFFPSQKILTLRKVKNCN